MPGSRRAFHFTSRAGGVLLLLLASACATSGAPGASGEPGGPTVGVGPEAPSEATGSRGSGVAAEGGSSKDEPAPTLEGGEWLVAELDGNPLLERSRITLAFEDGQVAGLASCNQYVAEWSRSSPARIRVGPPRSTLRACAPAVMDQERRFLDLLERLVSLEMVGAGELVLRTPEGDTLRARRQ